jgi:hypothetical protein
LIAAAQKKKEKEKKSLCLSFGQIHASRNLDH